ncbi:siderophore-interacting protein [Leucobacter sp. UT-8R-CII-1-4]|uniref:siderophore-interacting protein n=1 Tax=Leucobacter sp. UT-8R-CII-1-4 TaxID=3040075 RepID=UPI0024A7D515|nr:siderophore-interacting protein [Leucobacter sp. UT-8R-CII-1-4]MDI6023089.1 siderophore-interacting protein [Leucobacter sp. UT-8R-CII-1-4]
MSEKTKPLYGGRHSAVLEHPDHVRGINHGTMTITAIAELAPSVTRLTATLNHEGDPERWFVTNPAIRLELPDHESEDTVSRVYTVRAVRQNKHAIEIDVDVVRHPGQSVVMSWLKTLEIGDSTRILGPRAHFTPYNEQQLPLGIFADETAIPAVATIIRDMPTTRKAEIWVETPDSAVVTDLPQHPGVTLHWLQRSISEAPASTGRLVDAATEFSEKTEGQLSVWACGEHGEMKRIRDHFRKDRGLPREQVVVFGYWRKLVTSSEIDEQRLQRYEKELAVNPSMTVLDEFEESE